MRIQRPDYLDWIKSKRENGMVKVITGIRRGGKSYLLKEIYLDYLRADGVGTDQIILLELDETKNIKYRNPIELDSYIRSKITDPKKMYYIFIDEIQKSSEIDNPYLKDTDEKITFVDTILGLQKLKNADVYVTGSNSKMLSSDILTMFRGRDDEVRVAPLSFSEYYNAYPGEKRHAWRDFWTYGGMPRILSLSERKDKTDYLTELCSKIYIQDILEHNKIKNDASTLEDLLNYAASSIGSLTNPTNLAHTFASKKKVNISHVTIDKYLGYFEDAFLLQKALRYDVKGRKYINSPVKYYFADAGLRNARLNFRQLEESHMMENIIYNELVHRGYSVDVGAVTLNAKDKQGKSYRKNLEIDFVVNAADVRHYIQAALAIDTEDKRRQETESLRRTGDSFKKIVLVKDNIVPWHDEDGVLYLGLEQFLLDRKSLEAV